MRREAVRERLEATARRLGLDFSWTPLEIPRRDRQRLAWWLQNGMHAGMDYLHRTRSVRMDPRATRFPWARSALLLWAPYAYEDPGVPEGGIRIGRVARYAWCPDYHLALEAALSDLESEARRLGLLAKGYVDHGPLLERTLARRAGIGWQGKNTLILREGEGSYAFLAVLLTGLEIEPRAPAPPRCGRCVACHEVCPTGALALDQSGSAYLDARLCISYWTIEHRHDVPEALWSKIGGWLFGCDDCQSACPWNRFAAKKGAWPRLRPDPELAHPDLRSFFGLSQRAFRRRFEGTPFARTGRVAMARNALIVSGNLRDPAAMPIVRMGMEDPSPVVRRAAARALYAFGERRELLRLARDSDLEVATLARRLYDRL